MFTGAQPDKRARADAELLDLVVEQAAIDRSLRDRHLAYHGTSVDERDRDHWQEALLGGRLLFQARSVPLNGYWVGLIHRLNELRAHRP